MLVVTWLPSLTNPWLESLRTFNDQTQQIKTKYFQKRTLDDARFNQRRMFYLNFVEESEADSYS